MDFQINFGSFSGIFALPCDAVDRYLNEASHNELKVLLYIFRCCGTPVDEQKMAQALGMTDAEIIRCMEYWCQKKIIACPEVQNAVKAGPQKQPPAKKVIDTLIHYTTDEIAQKAEGNTEIRFLLDTVPGLLGRLISPSECSAIIYLYDGAGLPADVILMAVEYCVSLGKGNLRYIEKTALSWAEEGIDTHELAEKKILGLEARQSFEGKVKAITGITGRPLSQAEKQHIGRWHEWSVSPELIKMAYEICVNRTGRLSFSYINSILKSWHEKGYQTPEQAGNEQKPGAKPQKSPSFNVEDYVRLSMRRLHEQ